MVKPTGFGPNLHKLDLFFPYNILAMRNGKQFDFSIEVKDLSSRPDCKIGDFGNNIWFRTKPAMKEGWEGYESYEQLAKAVKCSLTRRGFTVLGWYERG